MFYILGAKASVSSEELSEQDEHDDVEEEQISKWSLLLELNYLFALLTHGVGQFVWEFTVPTLAIYLDKSYALN